MQRAKAVACDDGNIFCLTPISRKGLWHVEGREGWEGSDSTE